jgi:rod shape determining protein RodA
VLKSDYWYRFPWLLLATALALAGLGIAGIYAATCGGADPRPFRETDASKQVVWLAVSLAVFVAALLPSYTRLAHLSYWLYGISLVALIVLAVMRNLHAEIPGFIYPINHAYSWIRIPGTSQNLQPSELMKIALIMSLAYYLRYRKNYRTMPGLLVPFAMALVPTALVLYQPDLGTAMMLLPVLFLMLFAAGARGKHLLAVMLMGLAMVPIFYSSMRGYQRMRIDSWLLHGCAERLHFALAQAAAEGDAAKGDATRPAAPHRARLSDQRKAELVRQVTGMWRFRLWRLATAISWGKDKPEFAEARQRLFAALDAGPSPASFDALRFFFGSLLDDPGHQEFQAKIAVGAGGVAGRGWLQGTQTRYGLLPEAHTDFLFPTLAEQFGFVGAAGVVILYALLCLLGIDVSFSTTDPYGRLLVVGVVALIAAQSFLNIAMSIGMMPITGIPLPLMSYGGSSLVSSFLALGLLCNVAVRRLYLIAPRPFEWRE